jgi:phosphatidylglycerophosphatase A
LKADVGVMSDDVIAGIYASAALQVGQILIRTVAGT